MSGWSLGSTSLMAGLPGAGEGPAVGREGWLAGDASSLLPAILARETCHACQPHPAPLTSAGPQEPSWSLSVSATQGLPTWFGWAPSPNAMATPGFLYASPGLQVHLPDLHPPVLALEACPHQRGTQATS